eukprot:14187594-Alexandrium_andersonii.AAC.1
MGMLLVSLPSCLEASEQEVEALLGGVQVMGGANMFAASIRKEPLRGTRTTPAHLHQKLQTLGNSQESFQVPWLVACGDGWHLVDREDGRRADGGLRFGGAHHVSYHSLRSHLSLSSSQCARQQFLNISNAEIRTSSHVLEGWRPSFE